jgi:thymidylate kinase
MNSGRRGVWIAIFGPDGVGKSAVIDRLQQHPNNEFSGMLRFHFRPHFRLRSSGGAPVTHPHGQRARGCVISICKLVYWLADCWFGYVFAVAPMRRRGRLVVFDRYFPDILVDPVRYRLPRGLAKVAAAFARVVPQPDLCILLDAPADIVQRRKQEISLSESQRQRRVYLELFATLNPTLVVSASVAVETVADDVSTVVSALATAPHRTSSPCPCRLPI